MKLDIKLNEYKDNIESLKAIESFENKLNQNKSWI